MTIGLLLDPFAEKNPSGLGRSVFEMAKALLVLDTKNRYIVYLKKMSKERPTLPGSHWTFAALNSRYLWLTGARRMDRALDAYIFFTPVIPFFFRPKKSIVVALDFAYLDIAACSVKEHVRACLLYFIHRRSLRLATKIIAISTQTKEDIVRHFAIAKSKIEVVPIGYIEPLKEHKEIPTPEKFFLFAGVLKKRKNVLGIIRAFGLFAASHTDFSLLIAGKTQGTYYEQCRTLAKKLGIEERVRFLGYVTDAELAHLYSKATAFVFPSFIEGFGMPVLEAMSVGLPVITSNRGALAEVAGNAALLVDPESVGDIANAMSRIAADPALRQELIAKGYARAKEFSWQKTAERFLRIIQNISI